MTTSYFSQHKEVAILNLLFDDWIPTTTGFHSIQGCLKNAAKLQIHTSSMQFASITRLLLAACYQGKETSSKLLKGEISQKTFQDLERHKKQLDLNNGYLTCPDLTARVTTPAILMSEIPSGRTMVFDHHARDDKKTVVSEAEIALRLVEFHCAAAAGGNSVTGYRTLSPCADVMIGIAVGKTLLETLALNLVPDTAQSTASWTLPRVRESDLKNQSRETALSIAEGYTWVGQAVRLWNDGVGVARGFKLKNFADPMTAIALNEKQQEMGAVHPKNLEPWLLGCYLTGFHSILANTLRHAQSLEIPYQVRVLAQVSSQKNKVKILERIDSTFEPELLNHELAEQVLKIRFLLARRDSEFAARVFVSTMQDSLQEQKKEFSFNEFVDTYPFSTSRDQCLKIAKGSTGKGKS